MKAIQFYELRQFLDDLQVGMALRLDDLGARLDAAQSGLGAIQKDLDAIKGRLGIPPAAGPQFVAQNLGLTPAEGRVAAILPRRRAARWPR